MHASFAWQSSHCDRKVEGNANVVKFLFGNIDMSCYIGCDEEFELSPTIMPSRYSIILAACTVCKSIKYCHKCTCCTINLIYNDTIWQFGSNHRLHVSGIHNPSLQCISCPIITRIYLNWTKSTMSCYHVSQSCFAQPCRKRARL